MSFPLVRYVLMAAVRDRLVLSVLVVMLLGCLLSIFMGSAAIIEKDQFSVVFAAASLRILLVLGLVLFVVFFIRRSFEGKDIEFLLSRPVSRLNIIFSYGAAFSLIAVFLGIVAGVAVYFVSPHLLGYGHTLWVLSIIVEAIIMVNVALFFSMYISSSATASLITLGFYVFARMMGQLLGIVDSALVDSYGPYAVILQMVSVITPRLDLMGQTSWLIYGADAGDFGVVHILLQGVVFTFLVLFAASLDFIRRQF